MRIHQVRCRLLGRMIEMFQSVTSALDGRVVINHEPIFISSLESRQLRPEWRLQSTLRPRRNGCGCFVGAARHRERDLSSLWNINEKKSGRPLIRPASAWPSAGWMNPRPTRTLLSRGNSVRLLKEKQNNLILCHHLEVDGCARLMWPAPVAAPPFFAALHQQSIPKGSVAVHCSLLAAVPCRLCAHLLRRALFIQTRAAGVFRVPWPIFTGCRSESAEKNSVDRLSVSCVFFASSAASVGGLITHRNLATSQFPCLSVCVSFSPPRRSKMAAAVNTVLTASSL